MLSSTRTVFSGLSVTNRTVLLSEVSATEIARMLIPSRPRHSLTERNFPGTFSSTTDTCFTNIGLPLLHPPRCPRGRWTHSKKLYPSRRARSLISMSFFFALRVNRKASRTVERETNAGLLDEGPQHDHVGRPCHSPAYRPFDWPGPGRE